MSHLTRGAWIEILMYLLSLNVPKWSHLTRGAWIEIRLAHVPINVAVLSHLTRGAWIEILMNRQLRKLKQGVAPHTRCIGGVLVCQWINFVICILNHI